MKAKAVRLYGKNDLRLEEFELPQITDEEILAKVICDSLCMSSYKAAHEADVHKRVPKDIATNPTIIGHEFAGEIVEVGARWKNQFSVGDKFAIQPALNEPNGPVGILSAPGYSYKYLGGNSTYVIVPKEVMELGCLLKYEGPGYYPASLAEPLSCVIGAMHAQYHTAPGSYIHQMEIKQGGCMAILAGVGPMGLAAINYAINRKDRQPRLLIVTDIDQTRLDRAAWLYTAEHAAKNGIDLRYVNTKQMVDPMAELREMTGGKGFDDVFLFVAAIPLIEQADALLAFDGCFNFFAGPQDPTFKAPFNFYNVHYAYTHIVGTSGGNTNDMREALELQAAGHDASGFVTHIGGINTVIDTTMRLPEIGGGKKLMYMHFDMPLTALTEFEEKGKTNPVFDRLDQLVKANKGLWSLECEEYLLANSDKVN